MKNPFLLLSVIAALGAAPAFSQSNDAAAEADTPVPGLDLGEEVQAEPGADAGPRTYVKETFNDWALQCIEVPERDDVCQMYQLLKDAAGGNVAEVSIFKLESGGRAVAGGTFVVPLETLLTQKLSISVDGGTERRFEYSFCAPIGCYARVGFTAEDIQRFRAGAKAVVTIVPALAPDQKVQVDMSLSGFTAAYNAASVLQQ